VVFKNRRKNGGSLSAKLEARTTERKRQPAFNSFRRDSLRSSLRSERRLACRVVALCRNFESARLRALRFGAAVFALVMLRAKTGGR
jgi:hypothetical protein